MDEASVQRAVERIAEARRSRLDPALLDASLERARVQVELLATVAASLETDLPVAIQDGLREHFRPSAKHLAEVRGLMNQVITRLERIETEVVAERNARIDDLALLVDLISSGWRNANDRLAKIETALEPRTGNSAVVYRIERPDQAAS
ncbi:MAG: hypothetical protein JOY72_06975 [Actinobacteria bacterium]|nr:hypothetical protein [Actinomycetota bacterium]